MPPIHVCTLKVYSKKCYTHKRKDGRKECMKEKLKTKTAKAFMPNF